MSMHEGEILHAKHDGVHVLRLIGEIRYTLSASFDRFLKRLFTGTPPVGVVIDLTQTHIIDSTNLGLLVRIADWLDQCNAPKLVIISNREDINEILFSMGLDEVFNIVKSAEPIPIEAEMLPMEEPDRDELSQVILQAHRALMQLNENNQALFRDLVSSLEQEVEEHAAGN